MAIQLATMRHLGAIGGWKVGGPDGVTTPVAAPLPLSGVVKSGATVVSRMRGIEAEISFRFGRPLPPRDRDYTHDEVLGAIETCQAAIEILDPRFRHYPTPDRLTILADLGVHGGLVVGAPIKAWTPDMFATLGVELTVNGIMRANAVGSNPAGHDLMRLLVWLANCDVVRATGGLAAGAVATTGSWTGIEIVPPGGVAVAKFAGFPPVEVRFPA